MSIVPLWTCGWGRPYKGHVYRYVGAGNPLVGETTCVNQHIFKGEMINKKVLFKCRNIHMGVVISEDWAPWTLMPIMGHHGHVHGSPKHVRPWCPGMTIVISVALTSLR